MATRETVPDEVVYACVRERARTFSDRSLLFPIYVFDSESLRRAAPSGNLLNPAHKAAYQVFLETSIPTAAFKDQNRYYLVSTDEVPIDNVAIDIEGKPASVSFYPTKYGKTPLGLYLGGHKFALQSLWTKALLSSIDKTGQIAHGHDPIQGLYIAVDSSVVRRFLPSWLPERLYSEAVRQWGTDNGIITLDDGTKLIQPRRYVDFDPKIGKTGRAFIQVSLRTRMLPPPDFTFSKIIHSRHWEKFFNSPRLMMLVQVHGQRLKHPRTVTLDDIRPGPMENISYGNSNAADFLIDLLKSQKITLSEKEEQNIRRSNTVCFVSPYTFEDVEPIPMVPWYLSPIVTQSNYYLFEGMSKQKNITKAYFQMASMPTDVKAALTEALCAYLASTLEPSFTVSGKRYSIKLQPGPVRFRRKEASKNIIPHVTNLKTVEVDDFRFVELPEVKIFIRKEGTPTEIPLSTLSDKVYEEGYAAYKVADKIRQGAKIAVISPYETALNLVAATFSFDAEAILSRKDRGKGHPLINLEERLTRLKQFFEARAFRIVPILIRGELTPEAYEENMKTGLIEKCDAFIIIMPLRVSRETQDDIYFRTYNFGLKNNIPVIHYSGKTWSRNKAYYNVVFQALAHLNNRLNGLTFYVDIAASADFLHEYPVMRFVAIDLGTYKKDKIGFVTATGPLDRVDVRLTPPSRGINDAVQKLGDLLKEISREYKADLLVILKDNHFQNVENRGLRLPYDELDTNVLALEVLKSGGLSGFQVTKRGRGKGFGVTVPYGTGVITPDGEVHLFPHHAELEHGIWSSIRYSVTYALPGDKILYLPEDIAKLGAALSSTGSYHISPERTKYPDLLGKADKAASLLEGGAFDGLNVTQFSALLIE